MDPSQIIKAEHNDLLGDNDERDAYNGSVYKPRPQLPKPFVFMRSLADIIKNLDDGLIDVDPEYQREVVWTADRMTGLVDSLMEDFYIPPIILNKKTSSAPANKPKEATHVCVDGKQRLSSVRAFVKGMIPCHDFRGEKWWFCDTSNRRRKILPEEDQKKFLAKEFVSFEFVDLSPKQEEDLFARVQMGVQLSVAEKMRASTGPWQELARLFVDDFPVIYSLMKDKARAKDFQLTLSCFSQIVEVMHPTAADGVPILKTNHNALPKLLSNEGAVDDKIKSHLASVWSTFKDLIDQDEDVFTNANKYLRGVQTFAPVEMVAVVVLISIYSETRNKSLLLGDIRAMREAIRENFVDIRMNTSVWKFVWEFIDGLESIRGATNGSTVDRRVQPPSTNATAPVQRPMPTSTVMTGTEATVRTKPAQVLPARVKKEGHPSAPPSSRRPKRQRTDDNPSSLPVAQPLQVQSSPIPSRVSAAPVVQTLPLALNSHRASMTSTAPAALASPIRPTLAAREASPVSQLVVSAYSPTTTGHQSTLGSSVSTLKTSLGAFSPEHTEQQWAGIVRPTSSPHEPSLIAFSSHRGPLAKPRNTPRQPVPAQYNDFIDLTSDTEKERQDLLSAFKVKSPATEQRQTIIQSLGPKHNTHDQHRTRGYNNPYTRFKQEQNIVP